MNIISDLYKKNYIDTKVSLFGWVRNLRKSSNTLGFCNINDGSCVSGLQIVLSNEELIENFFKNTRIGTSVVCNGIIVKSPKEEQPFEMVLDSFEIIGPVNDNYPLSKNRIGLEKLRKFYHLRGRMSAFGSIFRIRSSLMKYIHDFYHNNNFLHLDPNIITTNECEGGAGVFQLTENNLSNVYNNVPENKEYDWNKDHFGKPVYLTVSSQLELEAMACCLGNVYTINKSFRSEHSNTTKHMSEFSHLEIEMVNKDLDQLMNNAEKLIKHCIQSLFLYRLDDIKNLNKFISKGLISNLENILNNDFLKLKYLDLINEINNDIDNKKFKSKKIQVGDDLSSDHENYITEKYGVPIFVTHWPLSIKSFYMKQCDDNLCESFDLLMPYGIGELVGGSQREEDLSKLENAMESKKVDSKSLEFYLDLRRYGTCKHGGFGMGFDRLMMLVTGMQNIRDVVPFPVCYKSCP